MSLEITANSIIIFREKIDRIRIIRAGIDKDVSKKKMFMDVELLCFFAEATPRSWIYASYLRNIKELHFVLEIRNIVNVVRSW